MYSKFDIASFCQSSLLTWFLYFGTCMIFFFHRYVFFISTLIRCRRKFLVFLLFCFIRVLWQILIFNSLHLMLSIMNLDLFLDFLLPFHQCLEVIIMSNIQGFTVRCSNRQIIIQLVSQPLLCLVSQGWVLFLKNLLFSSQMIVDNDLLLKVIKQLISNFVSLIYALCNSSVTSLEIVDESDCLLQIFIFH